MNSNTNSDGIRVWQHDVDWDDMAWSTMQRLSGGGSSPGTDVGIQNSFRAAMQQADQLGTRYVNPQFTVVASGPSPSFLHRARQAQLAWLKTLKTVLVTSGCLKRELKKRLPEIRQLEFTGVMVINGQHVHPQQWPDDTTTPSAIDLIGEQFGRLVVVRRVKNGRWLCKCECGGENTVRTKHLIRGKIRSCGCLKAETEAKQQERKANRGWVKSGVLT